MPSTNFKEWSFEYRHIFREKHIEFCELFDDNNVPSYSDFVRFIWDNTEKFVDRNGKLYARIN